MNQTRQEPWWYNDESRAVLDRGYLLNGETIHDAIDRITASVCQHLGELGTPELQERFKDAIYKEEINDSTKSRINVIAVKKGREKDENLLKLVELYHTPKVQEFIKEKFEGTKVEVKKDIKDVWKEAE